jgi:hypothetical protein
MASLEVGGEGIIHWTCIQPVRRTGSLAHLMPAARKRSLGLLRRQSEDVDEVLKPTGKTRQQSSPFEQKR